MERIVNKIKEQEVITKYPKKFKAFMSVFYKGEKFVSIDGKRYECKK